MGRDNDEAAEFNEYENLILESELTDLRQNDQILLTDGGRSDRLDRLKRRKDRYETFRNKYEQLMERHIDVQDELNAEIRTEHDRVVDEYGEVVDTLEEIDDEYVQMRNKFESTADELVQTFEEYSDSERSNSVRDLIQGALFFGAGFLAAGEYSYQGALDFYFNAASNYANEPETAILTLGLPLIGAWYFKNAFDEYSSSRELQREADTWRQRKNNAGVLNEDTENNNGDE